MGSLDLTSHPQQACFSAQCAVPGTGWAEIYDPAADAFTMATGLSGWNGIDTATLRG
jgi:hypothetical protein